MIAPFALDPTAVTADYGDPAVTRATHEQFLRVWREYGALVHGTGGDGTGGIATAVAAIADQGLRTKWQAAIKHQTRSPAPEGFPDLRSVEKADDLHSLERFVRVACLEPVRASCAGLEDASTILDGSTLELCRFDCTTSAHTFAELEELRNRPIHKGDDCGEVWRTRFAPLVTNCKTVTVIDRYCLEDHRRFVRDKDPVKDGVSGLRRLCQGVDGSGRPHILRIFASSPEDGSMNEDAAALLLQAEMDRLGAGGMREIQLFYSLSSRVYKDAVHDRSIRFDERVCQVGYGVEVLDGRSVKKLCQFSMCFRDDGYRELERELELRSRPRRVFTRHAK